MPHSPYATPPQGSPSPQLPGGYAPSAGAHQYGGPPGKRSTPWWVWALSVAVVVGVGVVVVVLLTSGDGNDDGGEGGEVGPGTQGGSSSIPSIPIGPGQGGVPTGQNPGMTSDLPPTSIPVVPGG